MGRKPHGHGDPRFDGPEGPIRWLVRDHARPEAPGRLHGELHLDASGGAIPGFEEEMCKPLRVDSVEAKVRWREKGGIGALEGRGGTVVVDT